MINMNENNKKFYSCGHLKIPIVTNTTKETLKIYFKWNKNNIHNVCLECWIKEDISIQETYYNYNKKIETEELK